jgi:hypothetical protein
MDYRAFLDAAREHLRANQHASLGLMRLLCDVHDTPQVWQHQHKSFNDVLRSERFCTISKFAAFRKALQLDLPVEKLGVDAACLLASYPAKIRKTATEQTLQWVATHKIAPTYQLVAEYVSTRQPGASKAPPKAKPSNAALRRYIATLQALCRKHGIAFPKEPE